MIKKIFYIFLFLLNLLNLLNLFSVEINYKTFKGLHYKIEPGIEKFLLKNKYGKIMYYYDTVNEKSGMWLLYPYIKLDSKTYLINVSNNPLSNRKGYTYLLILSTSPEIKIVDTIGPFYDTGIHKIGYSNIVNNDEKNELIIFGSDGDYNYFGIFKNINNKYTNIFEINSSDYKVNIIDYDKDSLCEIEILKSFGFDIVLINDYSYLKTIYYFNKKENKYLEGNKKYKKYLEYEIKKVNNLKKLLLDNNSFYISKEGWSEKAWKDVNNNKELRNKILNKVNAWLDTFK